jgi:asparagine synthase (glutamine-hydrolysing)
MNDQICHRGPDDEGTFMDGSVGLGMRRLSIIDVAGGHQPIANEDRSKWVVFNGEIYNYRDLRPALRKAGHVLTTSSDTEVIVHQFEEKGKECVHSFNGMFAFAVWNAKDRSLFLARDRMGVKPLYYYWDGRTLIFASELKSILSADFAPRQLNPEAVWHYLTFRYVPGPMTMWKNIYKLPPGHTMTLQVDTQSLVVERYWDQRFTSQASGGDMESDVAEFTALFLDAVRLRLISDVPVGVLLSGGLDSSAVAAAISEVHNTPLDTFCVGYSDHKEVSEARYARLMSQHVGSRHHEVWIDQREFVDFLPHFVWYTDEPLADPASVPLYFVSRLASKSVKVVLSGEGADEVLAGYTFEQSAAHWNRLRRFQRLPGWSRKLAASLANTVGAKSFGERLTIANIPLKVRNRQLTPYMTDYFSSSEKARLLPSGWTFNDSREIVRNYYDRANTTDLLHQTLYAYSQDWLVEDLLMKADKMTMAASIELRVPFLDYRLVEWLASRPSDRKISATGSGVTQTKYLLRRFAEGRIPTEILSRPKEGFPVPLTAWLTGDFGKQSTELITGQDSQVSSLFDREFLTQIAADGRRGNREPALRLWMLVVLELWLRRWN